MEKKKDFSLPMTYFSLYDKAYYREKF